MRDGHGLSEKSKLGLGSITVSFLWLALASLGFSAEGKSGVEKSKVSDAPEFVPVPGLKLALRDPQTAMVGQALTLEIVIQNTGDLEAKDVELAVRLGPNFRHKTKALIIKSRLGRLAGGEKRKVPLIVTPRMPGHQTLVIEASVAEGLQEKLEYSIVVRISGNNVAAVADNQVEPVEPEDQVPLWTIKIDPKTPTADLLPKAPWAGARGPVLLDDLNQVPNLFLKRRCTATVLSRSTEQEQPI